MDIEYKGANCIVISVKKAAISTDPKLSDIGLKDQGEKVVAQLMTQPSFAAPKGEDTVIVDGPGEYEIQNMSVKGIAAQAYMDAKGDPLRATMYRVDAEELSMAVVGHVFADLNEAQLEALGVVDVLVVPVGGNGYTLDASGAIKVVKAVDPKVVIPTHYAETGINYAVPQAELELFVKELGVPVEEMPKAKLKSGALPASLTIYKVTRTA